jgi:hypothetical protein
MVNNSKYFWAQTKQKGTYSLATTLQGDKQYKTNSTSYESAPKYSLHDEKCIIEFHFRECR